MHTSDREHYEITLVMYTRQAWSTFSPKFTMAIHKLRIVSFPDPSPLMSGMPNQISCGWQNIVHLCTVYSNFN